MHYCIILSYSLLPYYVLLSLQLFSVILLFIRTLLVDNLVSYHTVPLVCQQHPLLLILCQQVEYHIRRKYDWEFNLMVAKFNLTTIVCLSLLKSSNLICKVHLVFKTWIFIIIFSAYTLFMHHMIASNTVTHLDRLMTTSLLVH